MVLPDDRKCPSIRTGLPLALILGLLCVTTRAVAQAPAGPGNDELESAIRLSSRHAMATATYVRVKEKAAPDYAYYLLTAYHVVKDRDRRDLVLLFDIDDDAMNKAPKTPLARYVDFTAFACEPRLDLAAFRCTESGVDLLKTGKVNGVVAADQKKYRRVPLDFPDEPVRKAEDSLFALGNPPQLRIGDKIDWIVNNVASKVFIRQVHELSRIENLSKRDAGETQVMDLETIGVQPGFSGGPVIRQLAPSDGRGPTAYFFGGMIIGGDPRVERAGRSVFATFSTRAGGRQRAADEPLVVRDVIDEFESRKKTFPPRVWDELMIGDVDASLRLFSPPVYFYRKGKWNEQEFKDQVVGQGGGLENKVFSECEFDNIEFGGSRLTGTEFSSCRFTSPRFTRSVMNGVRFRRCVFKDAEFAPVLSHGLFFSRDCEFVGERKRPDEWPGTVTGWTK